MVKMSNMKLSKDTKSILYAIAILLGIVLLISLLAGSSKPTNSIALNGGMFSPHDQMDKLYGPVESFANDVETQGGQVLLFHATWCHHCVEYLKGGIFDNIAKNPEVSGITFAKYDADEYKDLTKKYDVSSFPTIVGVKKTGEIVPYTKDRDNINDLVEFAKSLL